MAAELGEEEGSDDEDEDDEEDGEDGEEGEDGDWEEHADADLPGEDEEGGDAAAGNPPHSSRII